MRSLHMKLVMIMVLLILSLMMVVGAFLINSVTAFYLEDFYSQMSDVFSDPGLVSDLTTETPDEENGAEPISGGWPCPPLSPRHNPALARLRRAESILTGTVPPYSRMGSPWS